jgi:hypothetical protein
MSFWFPRGFHINFLRRRFCTVGAACIALAGASGPAAAQYYYFQPRATVGVEVDSNRDLVTSGPTEAAVGGAVEGGATMGLATPLSDTTLRPDVTYTDYPKLDEKSVKSVLDFLSNYHTERAKFSIYGEISYSDLYSSELASAAFNVLNPNLPTTPETGRISLAGTRGLATVVPKFQYELTPRLGIFATGTYQDVSYGGVLTDEFVSYQYYTGTVGLDWNINLRSDISVGFDASRQSARNVYSVTDGKGADITYTYAWSQTFTGKLSLVEERDNISSEPQGGVVNPATSPHIDSTANGVGAQYATIWTGQISQIQVTIGRTFTPNGSGSTYRSDALQAEYKRQFSPRLSLDTAVHYIRNVALSGIYAGGDYNYLIASADLRWNLTRTWFVAGGVQYLDESFPQSDTAAKNAMAHVAFGYEGLGRQY